LLAAAAARGITEADGLTKRQLIEVLDAVDAREPDPDDVPGVDEDGRAQETFSAQGTFSAQETEPEPEPEPAPVHKAWPRGGVAKTPTQRWTIEVGSLATRGIGDPPAVPKHGVLTLDAAAQVGDRVCLSEHGSRTGEVSAIEAGNATVGDMVVPHEDCTVCK
jgi:hypothetical protein